MPIDASIPLSGREFRVPDFLGMQQQGMQLRQMQDAEQGRAREEQERVALSDLYRQHGTNRDALLQGAAQRGLGARIPGMQKQFADVDKEQAQAANFKALADKHGMEGMAARLQVVSGTLQDLARRPDLNHDVVRASLVDVTRSFPDMQPAAAKMYATMPPPDAGQPALREWLMTRGLSAQEKLKALTPDLKEVSDNKTKRFVDTNALTNPAGPAPITMQTTPGEDMTDRRVRSEGAAGRAQSERHFNATQNQPKLFSTDQGVLSVSPQQAPFASPRGTYVTDAQGQPLGAKQAPKKYDADRGILVDEQAGTAQPVVQAGAPIGPKDKPLPEGATKQVTGARNLKGAIDAYQTALSKWSNPSMLSPNDRAEMGTIYNNMLLQAKEAYNLGVLNGPDYKILQSVVADPSNPTSALLSRKSMSQQADNLKRIAEGIERTVYETHGKKPPAGSPAAPKAPTVSNW